MSNFTPYDPTINGEHVDGLLTLFKADVWRQWLNATPVSLADFDKLTSAELWIDSASRSVARQTLEVCVGGVLEHVNLPKVKVPAEFVAAVIVHFVSPVNYLLACSMLEGCNTMKQIINARGESQELWASEMDRDVLFSMVCAYTGRNNPKFAKHQDNVHQAIRNALNAAIADYEGAV